MSWADRRFVIGLLLAGSLVHTAKAETQAEIAARLNEEGKTLMFADPPNYAGATAKFQDAVARVPEAKYFFNLCTSLYQEGKFGFAITACQSVDKNNPDDKLKTKTGKLIDRIRDDAQKQGINLQPEGGGGGDPNLNNPINPENPGNNGTNPVGPVGPNPVGPTGPNPTGPNPTGPNPVGPNPVGPNGMTPTGPNGNPPPGYAVGRPPEQNLFKAAGPDNTYTWSMGIDFYGGGANIGQSGLYGTASAGFRLKADYQIMPKIRAGVEGYLQATNITAGSAQGGADLSIIDVGGAAYKHFCLGGRLCLTPLAGIQLALMDPNDPNNSASKTYNYAALGFRLEAAASIAFGNRFQYVLEILAGANIYTPVFSSPSDGLMASDPLIGLDKGGYAGYGGIGFTYRFNTPFGQAPFVTLE